MLGKKISSIVGSMSLIHGQVAGIWSTSLNTQRIIVANDEAAADPLQKSSLRMAAPTSMRLSVLPVATAAKNIRAGRYGKQRLFLLFKNPQDVLRYIEADGPIKAINVGNMSYKDGAREVTKVFKWCQKKNQSLKRSPQRHHRHGTACSQWTIDRLYEEITRINQAGIESRRICSGRFVKTSVFHDLSEAT